MQVITDVDLKNSGYTNVVDVLRNLSANGSGTPNQGFGQAFAAGASGIALRGLSVGDTLTLIDGQRMVSYPLSDDGERSFVDVSAIPINAIESVEVLKRFGASALYGADAIAGVVNVKLVRRPMSATNSAWKWARPSTATGPPSTAPAFGVWGTLKATVTTSMLGPLIGTTWTIYWSESGDGAFTTTNWSALPGGVNTQPGAIGASGLGYPDSATGYLINPNTKSTARLMRSLPGCDLSFTKCG